MEQIIHTHRNEPTDGSTDTQTHTQWPSTLDMVMTASSDGRVTWTVGDVTTTEYNDWDSEEEDIAQVGKKFVWNSCRGGQRGETIERGASICVE